MHSSFLCIQGTNEQTVREKWVAVPSLHLLRLQRIISGSSLDFSQELPRYSLAYPCEISARMAEQGHPPRVPQGATQCFRFRAPQSLRDSSPILGEQPGDHSCRCDTSHVRDKYYLNSPSKMRGEWTRACSGGDDEHRGCYLDALISGPIM